VLGTPLTRLGILTKDLFLPPTVTLTFQAGVFFSCQMAVLSANFCLKPQILRLPLSKMKGGWPVLFLSFTILRLSLFLKGTLDICAIYAFQLRAAFPLLQFRNSIFYEFQGPLVPPLSPLIPVLFYEIVLTVWFTPPFQNTCGDIKNPRKPHPTTPPWSRCCFRSIRLGLWGLLLLRGLSSHSGTVAPGLPLPDLRPGGPVGL